MCFRVERNVLAALRLVSQDGDYWNRSWTIFNHRINSSWRKAP